MKRYFLVLAALALGGAALPAKPPLDFNTALAQNQLVEASRLLEPQIIAHALAPGETQIDSVLAARLGRLQAAQGMSDLGLSLLQSVELDRLPPQDRAPAALAYARALEHIGQRARAMAAYRSVAALTAATPPEHADALLGVARLTSIVDPRGALAIAATIGPDPASAWEVDLERAKAASLSGDARYAMAFADRAWTETLNAPADSLAPLRVALVRAGLAAAAADRPTELAMLGVANSAGAALDMGLFSRLPACGENGLVESDWVIVGTVAGATGPERLIPIAASRALAVAPFVDHLAGASLLTDDGYPSSRATIATLSCAPAISGAYYPAASAIDPIATFLAQHGLYYTILNGLDGDEAINELGRRIDAVQAKLGKDSVRLLPLQLQMLDLFRIRAFGGDSVSSGRMAALSQSIASKFREGGSESLAASFEARADLQRLQLEAAGGHWNRTATIEANRKLLQSLPFDTARVWAIDTFRNAPPEMRPARAELVTALAERTPPSLKGGNRDAWFRYVADMQDSGGMKREARASLAKANASPTLCSFADDGLAIIEQDFQSDDFPSSLVRSGQSGATTLAFSIDREGKPTSQRILISVPSGLFDEVTREKARSVRYSPPERDGKPFSCSGLTQTVRWALPKTTPFEMPNLPPPEPDTAT